ncbi:MAG: ATP synthase F1 subunit epsilon [Christensenellaceae bacterium]|jgi:F-type H+-transporting ATPase subunit epsilon|nr:ATP synthase F1 subunit epsilon [Christensenellaceae bacterium]
MSLLYYEILTPEKTLEKGECLSVTLETSQGEVGIMYGHIPLVMGLIPGIIRIVKEDGKTEKLVCGEGFADVRQEGLFILCQTAERKEDLSYERVKKALDEHTVKFNDPLTTRSERKISAATISRAAARMRLLNE